MKMGGVQRGPEQGGLGQMSTTEVEAHLGRAVQTAMESQETEIRELKQLLDAARENEDLALQTLEKTHDDAYRLYAALRDTLGVLRQIEAADPTAETGGAVTEAAGVVLMDLQEYAERPMLDEDEDDAPLPECPECVAGKHPNCTHEVMVTVDGEESMAPCGCEARGHAG